MKRPTRSALTVALLFISLMVAAAPASAQHSLKTRTVVLIVSDGLRWQEIFTGADPTLMDSEHGGIWGGPDALKRKFWRDNIEERRKVLFPFLWNVIAKQGQIFGNQTKGSVARVTNGMAFSYPGYNEMLDRISRSQNRSQRVRPQPQRHGV